MSLLSPASGLALVLLFGAAMIALTYYASRNERWRAGTGFLVAWRNVPWYLAAPSIAASWIWAPALFVSVQKSYELGLAGIFWFTVPNIIALLVYMNLGPRIREIVPGGYTLPDWIRYRFASDSVHRIYLIPYLWYQAMAVCVQLFVGGMMLNYITGLSLNFLMVLLLLLCLAYSWISGLRASIVTDFVQMIFLVLGVAIIPLWVVSIVGWESIASGFAGIHGSQDVFAPEIAFSFGIVTSIGLIAGAISDQQYWQRAFAIKRSHLVPSYGVAGFLFGIVPLLLSLLGFAAANPALGVVPPAGMQLPMIGIEVVAKLLPLWATVFFVVMLLSGLMSTLDSGMCAASSLYAIDLVSLSEEERHVLSLERIGQALSKTQSETKLALDQKTVRHARTGMLLVSVVGLALAFVVQYLFSLDRLWWIFNGVATCFVVPTVLSLYDRHLSAKGVALGLAGSLLGLMAFVYGNWIASDLVTVGSALFILAVSVIGSRLYRRETPWDSVHPTSKVQS